MPFSRPPRSTTSRAAMPSSSCRGACPPVSAPTSRPSLTLTFSDAAFGDYVLVETKAPEGYVLDATPMPVQIREHGAAVALTVKNAPKPVEPSPQPIEERKPEPKKAAVLPVTGDGMNVAIPAGLAALALGALAVARRRMGKRN